MLSPSDTRGRALAAEKSRALLLLAALLLITLIPGCRKPVTVPPITAHPTGTYHAGKIVWADLITSDVESAKEFYGKLFGWQFEGEPGKTAPFTLITQGGEPIGGIVYREEGDASKHEARWLSYISVPDVDAAAAAAKQLGGQVYVAPFDLPQRGRVAVLLDPQKVPIGLLRASGGDPPDEKVTPFRWMWRELWTTDTANALVFYGKLAGYTQESASLSLQSDPYTVLMGDGRARAGMGQLPREGMEPMWLPYINVDDPQAIAAKTLTLGGAVLIAPDSAIRGGSVGLIADPTGGMLAIQRWTAEDTLSK
jgi:predicted enzyme related to lactoylglutathione lyase